nr:colicin immunity domain-containing protein [Rhodococcus sp. (in: high G+C Gram-positive bacteria)]
MTGRSVSPWLVRYKYLIESFVSGVVEAEQFESEFLKLFKNDTDQVPGVEFDVLDGLFVSIDEYVADGDLRARAGGIDDERLKTQAYKAYRLLFDA